MNLTYEITLEEKPDPNDINFVRKKLEEYNNLYLKSDNFMHLNVYLRDSQGRIQSGLIGMTYWGWLYVEILWVEKEIRRKGYGNKVLAAAEQEAIRRGCRFAHLDTLSFQALGFYKKQGYEVFGELKDLPIGHTRYFMKKVLIP